jgi:hypothetical protein
MWLENGKRVTYEREKKKRRITLSPASLKILVFHQNGLTK